MIRTVSQQNTACPYRNSNPDVVMMESAEQWDGAIFEDARELLRDSAWTPEIAARAVETTIEGIWGRLYFSVAHISFEDAIGNGGGKLDHGSGGIGPLRAA